MNRLASNSNNHSVHSNRVTGRFESGLETGSRPHFSGFDFEFEVFRIRQSNPPLTGQRGPDDNRDTPVPNYSKSIRKKPPVETGYQLPISDFKKPDLREFDTNEIRRSFYEQTRRKR